MSAATSTISTGEEIFAPGARLGDAGRYVVQSVIAIGGMAIVYRAWDEHLEDECAIKAFCAELSLPGSPGEREFHEEALLLARLRHPGIVAVRDHFFQDRHAFLVMDFVPGDNLYDRHRRTVRPGEDPDDVPISPIPESQVAAYGIMLGETLSYLHRLSPPVIYRDLKPHNIILRGTDRRLVLLDFGIARLFKASEGACDTQAMGTPGYAAPEQYDAGLQTDPRTDIYSLGVVLYELATGHNPRAEGASRKLPWAQDVRASVTPAFAALLARCTAWERAGRFESAQSLVDDLKDWQRDGGRRRMCVPSGAHPAWRITGSAPIMATPALAEGTLFFTDCQGIAVAADGDNGHVRWRYQPQGPQAAEHAERGTVARTALAVSRDAALMAVVYPCGEGMLGASLVDAQTGDHLCLIKAPLARQVFPQIVERHGRSKRSRPERDVILALGSPNQVISISLSDRSIRWRRALASPPMGLFCLDEDTILVTDAQGFALAIELADGALAWNRRICHGPLTAPPLIAPESLVIGGAHGDGQLASLCPKSGEPHWQVTLGAQTMAAPIASGGCLVIPTRNAGLIGLNPETGARLWHRTDYCRPLTGGLALREPGLFALAEYGDGARLIVAQASEQGDILWEAPLPAGGAMAPPAASQTHIVVLGVSGTVCAWELGAAR